MYYKYASLYSPNFWKNLDGLLLNREVYVPTAIQLNDPYECVPGLSGKVGHVAYGSIGHYTAVANRTIVRNEELLAHAESNGELSNEEKKYYCDEFHEKVSDAKEFLQALSAYSGYIELAKCIRVLSLTKGYKNLLMWSHYGGGHNGVCFEFNTSKPLIYVSTGSTGLEDMEYSPHPLYFSYKKMIDFPADKCVNSFRENLENWLPAILRKPKCWSYEEEIRQVSFDVFEEKGGTYPLDNDCSVNIYIGANVSDVDTEKLISAAKQGNYETGIYKCFLSEYTFGIECSPIFSGNCEKVSFEDGWWKYA